MILTGPEITKRIHEGALSVEPFVADHVNPASIDLTLGTQVRVYKHQVGVFEGGASTGRDLVPGKPLPITARAPLYALIERTIGLQGWFLFPGVLYLMHTAERVCMGDHVGVLDGKSSMGRLFMQVHMTAGYVDPGWEGQLTLEVQVGMPILVHSGMRIAQLRVHTVLGEVQSYQQTGRYVGEKACGAVGAEPPRRDHAED